MPEGVPPQGTAILGGFQRVAIAAAIAAIAAAIVAAFAHKFLLYLR
jgi:hypothetical protein